MGCRFVLTDLDNVALGVGYNAAKLPFGVALANPNPVSVEVMVKSSAETLATVWVAPHDAKLLELPHRSVDGSSEPEANDGTHSARTESGYAIDARMPIAVVMFNPLGRDAYSADASLVLPTTALGRDYTVAGFPQSIADDDDPNRDFDRNVEDEDQRSFISVLAVDGRTAVDLTLGPDVVLASDGEDLFGEAGGRLQVELSAFEVLNLETDGYGASFSGTRVSASQPIAVFSGAESTDIPFATSLASRQCCADHLETQLLPNALLGQRYGAGGSWPVAGTSSRRAEPCSTHSRP